MNKKIAALIFQRFAQNNPHPTTELNYNNPFELLIAVILSAQATDKSVNKVTENLFKTFASPQSIIDLGEEKLKDAIKTIGLFNSKAKNIIKTCEILLKNYHGDVPSTREALEGLPGVGRKTANVLLNTAFQQPTVAVDTHIFRVANRSGLAKGKTPLEVELKLLKIIPENFLMDAHHWLVLHGRYVCKAKKPECYHCIIEDLCEFKNKNL